MKRKDIQKELDKEEDKLKNQEKKVKELKEELRAESEKDIWLEIPEKGIKITIKLQFKGKTYPEILKEVDESEIANYPLLQSLRNEGFKSGWKKYEFLKDTWAFVPNPDEVSKANGYVAGFGAGSGCSGLNSVVYSDGSDSNLGVFLVKKISNKEIKK